MTLALRVQHHPSRVESLARLFDSLGDDRRHAEVTHDPDPKGSPSAWRTYRKCLADPPSWASHVLIVQDDAVAAPGLYAAAEVALAELPDALVAFFHPTHPPASVAAFRQAQAAGQRFVPLWRHRWIPTVALAWPVERIPHFLAWVEDDRKVPPDWRADDPLVGGWATKFSVPAYATVPCLVEHPDDVPSILKSSTRRGPQRMRQAAVT